MIRVLLVDDDPIVRSALSSLLPARGVEVVACVATVAEGVRFCQQVSVPHVVLLDVYFGADREVTAIKDFHACSPEIKVITLTSDPDPRTRDWALAHGADGFVHKSVEPATIAAACIEVAHGNFFLVSRGRPDPRVLGSPALTEREAEIGALIRQGLSNPEIASRLHLSESAVKKHVTAILRKLNVTTRVEAARLL